MTPDVVRAVNAASMAEKGILPVGGGMLDQTTAFEAVCRLVWQTESKLDEK